MPPTYYTQLTEDLDANNDAEISTTEQHHDTSTHPLRIYTLATIVCFGGLLFGYDSGVIGGVLTFPSFHTSFAIIPDTATSISSISVGIQQAGALLGCLLITPVTNAHGRRRALMLCSAVFCTGVIFEILDLHSLSLFYIGRVICGLGIGGSATVAPIYLAEMAPSHLRGRLGSGYQFTFTVGILVSYWLDYALQFMDARPSQWQVPLALQILPGAAMGLGMVWLPESVRWLLDRGDEAGAWRSLAWARHSNPNFHEDEVASEFNEMKRAVETDRHETADFHPRELLRRPNLKRVLLAVGIFIAQQATGATAMAYFGPQFFEILVGSSSSSEARASSGSGSNGGDSSLPLLLTGIFGLLKVTSCLVFILLVADRFGRRPLLGFGAAGMSLCLIATSILLSTTPTSSSSTSPSTPSDGVNGTTIPTILLIYLTITLYNLSWGPLPWPYVAEIFPTTRLRSPGVSLAVAAQWLSNFIWSSATPYILRDLKWATFLLFGGLDLVIAGVVWWCVPETRGLTLEGVQGVFGDEYEVVRIEEDGGDGVGEREGMLGGDSENEDGDGDGKRDSASVSLRS